MTRRLLWLVMWLWAAGLGAETLNLAGAWGIALDPQSKGIAERWFEREFTNSVTLPGCLQAQGYGEVPGPETKWWPGQRTLKNDTPALAKYNQPGNYKIQDFLLPSRHYIGAAWYVRELSIPKRWAGKHITLFLERCHWESRVWLDGKLLGSNDSLAAPHVYELSGLTPGKHRLALRIDNSQIIPLGNMPHSVSEQTQGTWNGVVGEIALKATDPVWLESVQVYPDLASQSARVVAVLGNLRRESGVWRIDAEARGYNAGNTHRPPRVQAHGALGAQFTSEIAFDYPLGPQMALWDEFHPRLYRLTLRLQTTLGGDTYADELQTSFGMRDFKTQGTQFAVNGVKTFLRGNVDCALYPKTGFAPMSLEEWRRVWKTYREFGLNHARFHSWCPPKAAFLAADEAGIYLAPELHEWTRVTTQAQEGFFIRESRRLSDYLGNHPSFVMMQLGNEMGGNRAIFDRLLAQWRASDPRRLYSIKANTRDNPSNIDFEVVRQAGSVPLRYQRGWPPRPEGTAFITQPPQTVIDWRQGVQSKPYPLLQHESAQFCSYPDVLKQLPRFTGYLKPAYLDIARDQLRERGMLEQVPAFVEASGRWQVELIREEIEAAFRTPGLGGFQWLCLNDFTGQNCALVGLTDPFWEPKPYVRPRLFRRFCGPTVLLARLPQRVWTTADTLTATFEVSHYGREALRLTDLQAVLRRSDGHSIKTWHLPPSRLLQGSAQAVGSIELPLGPLAAPAQYNLRLVSRKAGLQNDWNLWLFPNDSEAAFPEGLVVSRKWDAAVREALLGGKTVLLLPQPDSLKGGLPVCFTTHYWTSIGEHGGQSSASGILLDPKHPLFASFPTEAQANWQWWDLLTHCQPMILDQFQEACPWPKDYRPLLQPIDSWKDNRKLALVAEAKVGAGRLLICSMDIESNLHSRSAARQFRSSLLNYIQSPHFKPTAAVRAEAVAALFEENPPAGTGKSKPSHGSASLPADG